jgi:hypothetical protein
MSKATEILNRISNQNRIGFRQRQINEQRRVEREQEAIGIILSYDASVGLWKVRDGRGNILFARAISNSASLCRGNTVSLSIAHGGIPVIDAMPV